VVCGRRRFFVILGVITEDVWDDHEIGVVTSMEWIMIGGASLAGAVLVLLALRGIGWVVSGFLAGDEVSRANRFDGSLADVFELQDQITAGVVAAIEPSVRRAEIERAKCKRPDNLDAYGLYLRALEHAYTFTPDGREAALSLLDAAIALDPGYAEAHGVAAWCLQQRYRWGGDAHHPTGRRRSATRRPREQRGRTTPPPSPLQPSR